jgi:hypothetical protein
MKNIYYSFIFILAGLAACFVAACSDDEVTGGSTPVEAIGNPVTGITLTNATGGVIALPDIDATVTVQVSATPANADDAGNYVFTSSDTKVFTITQEGVITATGYGEATLNVVAQNNTAVTAACKVSVVGKPVTAITFNPETYTVTRTNAVGPVFVLAPNVTVTPADASVKALKYTSSHPEVAIVSEDGDVWPLWEGVTVIKAEALDGSGLFATCTYTVNITKISSLSFYANTFNALNINSKMNQTGNNDLSPADYAKGTGTTSAIRYQPTNATLNTLEYSSSDEEVLEIQATSSNGFRLIPKKGGRATITAAATDGSGVTGTSNPINVYGIYPHTDWRITESSPTGELQDGNDVWGGTIANLFEDGKQVGFYRQGTTQLPVGSYPYFIIDFGASLPFNYIILSHSWAGNYNSGTRSNRLSMSGSNDGTTYTSIVSSVTASPAYNYFSVLSQVHTYRFLKVEIWNTTNYSGASGTSVAATPVNILYDFNVGYLPPL